MATDVLSETAAEVLVADGIRIKAWIRATFPTPVPRNWLCNHSQRIWSAYLAGHTLEDAEALLDGIYARTQTDGSTRSRAFGRTATALDGDLVSDGERIEDWFAKTFACDRAACTFPLLLRLAMCAREESRASVTDLHIALHNAEIAGLAHSNLPGE